jgi:hypothetical protein
MVRTMGIIIVCDGAGRLLPQHSGRWLKSANIENGRTMPDIETTDNPDEALGFADAEAALEFWRRTSTTRPMRPDGTMDPAMGRVEPWRRVY